MAKERRVASKKDEYETKVVRTAKDVKKHVAKGWEVVSTSGQQNWFRGSDYQAVLRRPNPKYKPKER